MLQVASTAVGLLVAGRLIAGFGVGFVSAIIILYMSEVAPKAVRGAIVSGYQFFITVGLLLASVVDQATHNNMTSASYRIPMAIQWVWAIILGTGLFLLPESPRWYVMKDRRADATKALATLRGQPLDSAYIKDELEELVANWRYEMEHMQSSWVDCFRGGWKPSGNLRRVVLGVALQMFQQWTGVNFICKYPPAFAYFRNASHRVMHRKARNRTDANSYSLLRYHLFQASRHEQRLCHLHDYHGRQCTVYAHLILDH